MLPASSCLPPYPHVFDPIGSTAQSNGTVRSSVLGHFDVFAYLSYMACRLKKTTLTSSLFQKLLQDLNNQDANESYTDALKYSKNY